MASHARNIAPPMKENAWLPGDRIVAAAPVR
jgi:hypothetical protein